MLATDDYGQWQPGFAKRHAHYEDLETKAAVFTGCDATSFDIDRAVSFGLPELTSGERDLLRHYLAYTSRDRLKEGDAFAFPRNELVARCLGASPSKIRRLKGSLEGHGLILRRYDYRNRHVEGAGIDLSPFFLMLPDLLKKADAVFSDNRAAIQRAKTERLHPPSQDDAGDRPEPIRPRDYPSLDHLGPIPLTHLQALAKHVTAIQGAIEAYDAAQSPDAFFAHLTVFVERWWSNRNTHTHTWRWCIRKYGWAAVDVLVVARLDPQIRDPQAFLGWAAAAHKGELNLAPNLARIETITKRKTKAAAAPTARPATAPDATADDRAPRAARLKAAKAALADIESSPVKSPTAKQPFFAEILRSLAQRVGSDAMAQFFWPADYSLGSDGGGFSLVISMRSQAAAQEARSRFSDELSRSVAEHLGSDATWRVQ